MDLTDVAEGTPVVVGARVVPMPAVPDGARVVAVGRTGDLLVISEEANRAASDAVTDAHAAFEQLASADPDAVSAFFTDFADRLADDTVWATIAEANAGDVERARYRGRSTTRLAVSDKMRVAMVDGLRGWAATKPRVGTVVERRDGPDYRIERRVAPLGVVAFVFEGRPNVFADGAGVVRNGNAAVMRIGGDALDTAVAVEELALQPALAGAGLPEASVRLVRSRDHGAGQALFTMPQVRLAVARGSGPTVALLGSIAEQHGIPASLHGTGGAWMFAEAGVRSEVLASAVRNSLDRKVCNTLNVLVLDTAGVATLAPAVDEVLREVGATVHVVGDVPGVAAKDVIDEAALATEWEWEDVPEVTVVCADGLPAAADLANRYSPHFVASIVSRRPEALDELYAAVDAPYVGNGFTRWVDGQWAWERPELGLTNWERGRLLGRSGILSGDDIVTIRDVFVDTSRHAPQSR